MDEATIYEFLKAYPDPKETIKKLEALLVKAEKEIYSLQEAVALCDNTSADLRRALKT